MKLPQFTLRALLVLITVVALVLGFWGQLCATFQ